MPSPHWTRPFTLDPGHVARLTLGPLRLSLQHLDFEWRLLAEAGPEAPASVEVAPLSTPLPGAAARFGFSRGPTRAAFGPRLADRPVIVRPEQPFTLLPGEELRAYVSSPLWVVVRAMGPGAERELTEVPSRRPSDTWFGPNPREGALCYASNTRMRLSPSEGAVADHRAVTPVVLANTGAGPMEVARLRLPARHLSLFADDQARWWTQRVTLRGSAGPADDAITIDDEPPREAGDGPELAPPRERRTGSMTLWALEPLLRRA